jgi:hypothetical protein
LAIIILGVGLLFPFIAGGFITPAVALLNK